MAMDAFERAREHFMAALEAQKAGRLTEAEVRYRDADALVPGRISVMTNLAAVLIEQGCPAEARPWCEKVLAAEPGNVDALLNLAQCHLADEDLRGALQLLDRGLAISPTHAGALSGRGSALFRLGRTRDALASFRLGLRCPVPPGGGCACAAQPPACQAGTAIPARPGRSILAGATFIGRFAVAASATLG
jgi:Flp pilus assembly protein TadD